MPDVRLRRSSKTAAHKSHEVQLRGSDADLGNSNLQGADLRYSNLQGAYISGCSLRRALELEDDALYYSPQYLLGVEVYPKEEEVNLWSQNLPDGSPKKEFLERMKEGAIRATTMPTSDFNGFLKARLELLESDIKPDRLLINVAFNSDPNLAKLNQAIYDNCRIKYPNKFKELQTYLQARRGYEFYGIKP